MKDAVSGMMLCVWCELCLFAAGQEEKKSGTCDVEGETGFAIGLAGWLVTLSGDDRAWVVSPPAALPRYDVCG